MNQFDQVKAYVFAHPELVKGDGLSSERIAEALSMPFELVATALREMAEKDLILIDHRGGLATVREIKNGP